MSNTNTNQSLALLAANMRPVNERNLLEVLQATKMAMHATPGIPSYPLDHAKIPAAIH